MTLAAAPAAVETAADLPPRFTWQRGVPRAAGVGRRAVAFGLDAVVVFLLAWTVTFVAATASVLRIPDITVLDHRSPAAGLLWVVSVFELPIGLAYFTLFEARLGRTPGKLLAGLRVRRVDGLPTTLFDAFLRNLLRLLWVTPFGPAFVLLDLWSLRATELDQRMGDLAAGTVVVHEPRAA